MGNPYTNEEEAIKKIRAMPEDVRELLAHHFRNSLMGIINGVDKIMEGIETIETSKEHILEDLKKFNL